MNTKFSLTIFITLLLLYACGSSSTYYYKVYEGDYDEVGSSTGYINEKGDTVIPIGKYYYCYTDTLKKYAIVMTKKLELIAIDKNEKKLFDVFMYESGPDYPREGLFRITGDSG